MKSVARFLRRFGGRNLLDRIEAVDKTNRDVVGVEARNELEARLRAIDVQLDVMGRNRVTRRG